ncbi:MAG: hypothetical protein KF914_21360 [Rhizobiaceae bacterium]|nr:hypothetical protein [Rhizobiaceae bacterium]
MRIHHLSAAAIGLAVAFGPAGPALADKLLGSYVARISDDDKHASDGYALDTAAQMVRQDRANWHKFGRGDAEDQDDPWFGSTAARARLEKLLGRGGAMSARTRQAIARGNPVIQVDVFANSVKVEVIGR